MSDRKGRFLTIEGSEGAGKSSNIEVMSDVLTAHNIPFHHTREPGGTPMAEEIRECLLAPRDETVTDTTELLLMFAARAQHVTQVIHPRLARGEWIICDRFTDATYAYQGAARGMDTTRIAVLEEWVHGDLQPDLTLFLDLDPKVGAARIADRAADRLEQENLAFFQAVRRGYASRAVQDERFRTINAGQSLDDVMHDVRAAVEAFVIQDRERSASS